MQNDTSKSSSFLFLDLNKVIERIRTGQDVLIIPALFLLSFVLHAATAARAVTFSDSGDILMAISTVGNCHGPGYPLYLMTAKLFSLLVPFGSLAFRVSLYSGILASLTTCLIYWIIYRVSRSRLGGAIGALAYCFSYTFWYQTVIPETYSLTTFITAALILFALRWERQLERGWKASADNALALFALFFGLALSNHFITIYLLPAFIFFALDTNWRAIVAPRNIFRMAVFFALGLLPYLYEPTAAFRGPAYNYGDPSTLKRWFQHLTFYYTRGGLFKYPYILWPGRVGRYFGTLNTEFPYFAWLGGVGFLSSLTMRKKKYPLFLLLLFILSLLPVMTYNQIEPVLRAHFYYMSYMIFTLWIGIGVAWVVSFAKRLTRSDDKVIELTAVSLVFSILILCPILGITVHYGKVDKSNYHYAYDMALDILETPEPTAVVLVDTDNTYYPCRYMQVVERKRTGVRVVNAESAGVPGFEGADLLARITPGYETTPGATRTAQIVERNFAELPVYTAVADSINLEWRQEWFGYLLRILPSDSAERVSPPAIHKSHTETETPYADLDSDAREALALPDALKANLELSRKAYQEAADMYHKVIPRFEHELYVPTLYSCGTFSVLYDYWGNSLNSMGRYSETVHFLPKSKQINPDNYSFPLANALIRTGRPAEAIYELERLISLDQGSALAYSSLGEAYIQLRDYEAAAGQLERAVKIDAKNPGYHYLYGLALLGTGRKNSARDQFKTTINLDPKGRLARAARDQLNVLEK